MIGGGEAGVVGVQKAWGLFYTSCINTCLMAVASNSGFPEIFVGLIGLEPWGSELRVLCNTFGFYFDGLS